MPDFNQDGLCDLYFTGNAAENKLYLNRGKLSFEDATEKAAVTPGPIVPAREVLARMLLEAGRNAEALSEFEAVMKKEPNRLRATAGAALAAERSGDAPRARDLHARVLEIAADADTPLPEVAQAKRFLGRG